jgi:hypothetical protein
MTMTQIPNNLIARIQKLIALADAAAGNEIEAAAASAKVQSLLAQYNLEMSQVIADDETAEVNVDAARERDILDLTGLSDWQRKLLFSIADNNFCLCYADWDKEGSYNLIGRSVNVATVRHLYDYLSSTITRLNPFTDRRTRAHNSWKDGCSDRLIDRLTIQRREAEAASRAERRTDTNQPRGNGSDLVLSDVHSSEADLNRDFRFGYAPGTTARERVATEARWAAEREARRNAPVASGKRKNKLKMPAGIAVINASVLRRQRSGIRMHTPWGRMPVTRSGWIGRSKLCQQGL